ncbi:MAG: endonuclease/exonuclease/phosphatase family protein [Pseudomonadota bacterium]
MALISALGIVAVLAGYYGGAHPAFDTLGVLRLHAIVGFAGIFVFAMAFVALTARYLALAGIVIAAAGIAPAMMPQDPIGVTDVRLYNQNLRFDNASPQDVVAIVETLAPDVVSLQEVTTPNRTALAPLRDQFRTEVFCEFGRIGDLAILSNYALIGAPGCARGQGVAWARLRAPAGEITVATVHMPWPWPYGRQQEQVARVGALLADLEEPLVILGDLNAASWSHSTYMLEQLTGTRTVRGLRLTFQEPAFWPGLPLDHVLVSEDLAALVEKMDTYGSDHAGLFARVRFR